jgi:hypothetical protein
MHQMKKVAILLLLSIYAVASFGISLNAYYCCGKLKAVTVSFIQQKDAKCMGGAGPSCCNTKHRSFKIHDSHIATPAAFHFHGPFIADLSTITKPEIQFFAGTLENGTNKVHDPPLLSSCPLYTLHCQYRI